MADISDVGAATIKDLYERLESLSCMFPWNDVSIYALTIATARIMTRILY